MTKFKFLRQLKEKTKIPVELKFLEQLKEKAKNPNALKLLQEIDKLLELGNETRAKLLLERYEKRYAFSILASYLKKASTITEQERDRYLESIQKWISKLDKTVKKNKNTEQGIDIIFLKNLNLALTKSLKNYSKSLAASSENIILNVVSKCANYLYDESDFTRYQYGEEYSSPHQFNKVNPWWRVQLPSGPEYKDYFREYPNLIDNPDDLADREVHEPELNNNLEYKMINPDQKINFDNWQDGRWKKDWMGRGYDYKI